MNTQRTGRAVAAVALMALLAALLACPAGAHETNPNFQSHINGFSPEQPDLHAEVLGGDDSIALTNDTGRTVTVSGYDGEPYARILADGTAQENERSPATYLNEQERDDDSVPAIADPKAKPEWKTIDKTGRIEFDDRRMHWNKDSLPPQVTDQSKRTTVFDYTIPMQVGNEPVKLLGTLYWLGDDSSGSGGFPAGAVVALVVVALAAIAVVVRARRGRTQ